MNIRDIIARLVNRNDIPTANVLSRMFFKKSFLHTIETPIGCKVGYICCESPSKTEQLMVLRKALFDLRAVYDWIPPLNNAELIKLRGIPYKVYSIPISLSYVNDNPEFIDNLTNSHKNLRLIKRRR